MILSDGKTVNVCQHCGHVVWRTGGIRACGSCDLMGEWPRINGTAETLQESVDRIIRDTPYDWESDGL
jgi:hypothetical protein